MKRFNNLYKYTVALLLIIGVACDTLDQDPVNQIPVEGAITTARNAERALQGMYDAMQSTNYYGLRYLYYQDTYTDNLQHAGTFTTDQEVSFRRINPTNLQIRSTWQTMYAVIRNANFVLYSLPNITDATPAQLTAFEAEARFIRALVYYDLVRVFDGVPLVTSFTDSIENIDFQARASVEEIYSYIIAELLYAEQNLVAFSTPYRAKPIAATALLGRVYLQSGQNNLAAQKASEVIESGNFSLQPNYRDLFTVQGNSEMILELNFTNVSGDQSSLAISSDPATGGQKFYLRPDFYNLFAESAAAGDTRFAASVVQQGPRLRVIKYFRSATNDDNVPLIRLAEMYLIRAEANARLAGATGLTSLSILNDINVIRNRARLAPLLITDIATIDTALGEILQQRRFELAFEGHRYSDLRRYGLIGNLFPENEQFRVVWPIPFQEIEVNNSLVQNPGY